jgi:hypothetical protein
MIHHATAGHSHYHLIIPTSLSYHPYTAHATRRSPLPPSPPTSTRYEKTIKEENPGCLSTLRRMLQAGPITCLYTGGGNKYVKPHEGFGLRMPEADVEEWTMINDKGELVDIPRPAYALRVWNAEALSYDSVEPTLNGAPVGPEETDAWFIGVVKKLKASNYLGPELLNALVTSKRTASMEALERRDIEAAFEGEVSSRWVELVLAN